VYVRKEIVHNRYVVDTLAERGAIFVDETTDVPEDAHVVFSAHGVSPAVRGEAKSLNLNTLDATCPLVTKVHNEVKRFDRDGYTILFIGHKGHEEVEGTMGEAPHATYLVDGLDGVDELPDFGPEEKLIWLSQTTLSVDETMEIVNLLHKRYPQLENPPSDDICYATQNRQSAVKAIAPQCDLLIVVGSQNSSNSKRLREVGVESGAKAGYLIDYASQIEDAWLEGVETVGVTSGASVPEILVKDVLATLAEHGFTDVETVQTATEKLVFGLPREIRPANRAKR